MDLSRYRRQGRWAKRILIGLAAYLLIGYLLIGVNPSDALLHPGRNLA